MNEYNFTEKSIWEETDNYLRLNSRKFGLPVDLLIDEYHTYVTFKHPFVCFFRNSYNPSVHDYVPVSITSDPQIVFDKKINLYREDVNKILDWIRMYRKYLIKIATCTIPSDVIFNIASKDRRKNKRLVESLTTNIGIPVYEIAVIPKSKSGLNWDVWLDDDELYKKGGHAMRIKVQDGDHPTDTNSWNPYIISKSEFAKCVTWNYSNSDKNSIDAFVDANYSGIMDLANNKIEPDDFKIIVRKVYKVSGSKWIAETPKEIDEPDFVVAFPLKYGYDAVYSVKRGGYNIMDENGELSLDDWYPSIDNSVEYDIYKGTKSAYFILYTEDSIYKFYPLYNEIVLLN